MTTKDDRQEFEANKREMSLALGRDTDVFRQTLEHVVRLSAQVAEAREEFSRRRERLAAG